MNNKRKRFRSILDNGEGTEPTCKTCGCELIEIGKGKLGIGDHATNLPLLYCKECNEYHISWSKH